MIEKLVWVFYFAIFRVLDIKMRKVYNEFKLSELSINELTD